MALIFNKADESPQTHLLIIGVGAYPYLHTDAAGNPQTDNVFGHLRDLTSPAESAAMFYREFIGFKKSLARPLGSIEVLISDPRTDGLVYPGLESELPTVENIETAYYAWKARCDTNEDNVAIFFFSGHGFELTEHLLVAADFGRHHDRTWISGLIDFDSTRMAFHGCLAQTQLFFVDTCRTVDTAMLLRRINARIIDGANHLIPECKFNLTVKAAAHNEQAFGFPDRASFFTKALLNGLRGNGAEFTGGQWVVSIHNLSGGINSWVAIEGGGRFDQRCSCSTTDTTAIIKRNTPPSAVLLVDCNPREATGEAEMSCVNVNTKRVYTQIRQPNPWIIDLTAGIYQIDATFHNPLFKSSPEFKVVNPPGDKHIITCA